MSSVRIRLGTLQKVLEIIEFQGLFFFGSRILKDVLSSDFEVMIILPIFVSAKRKDMPTIFILFGFRFLFYANDHEPIHVHVVKGDICAKFTLFPEVELVENKGLKPAELKLVESVIEENKEIIAEHWNKFFNRSI